MQMTVQLENGYKNMWNFEKKYINIMEIDKCLKWKKVVFKTSRNKLAVNTYSET